MITAKQNISDMKFKTYIRPLAINILITAFPVWLSAQGIHLTAGANMRMTGPVYLVLNNAGFITDGSLKQDLTSVIFTGNATTVQPLLGGSNNIGLHHVTINRPSNDVKLNGNVYIDGTLAMINGNLQLNNYYINLLGTGNISGETSTSCIKGATGGSIHRTVVLNAPQAVNPGNIGIAITSTANLGQTVITRTHTQQQLPDGVSGIQRVFSIVPANNTSLNATLRFYYLDTELAGNNENDLMLWSRADVGNNWLPAGVEYIIPIANYLVKSGIDHFTDFTLAPGTVSELLRVNNNVTAKASATGQPNEFTQTSVRVYPNPLQEQFVVSLASSEEKEYVINLYNQYGQLLQSKKPLCRKGINQIYWNMSDYANGVYFVVFENDGLKSIKVIKQ
jgi:hypothetical protein